MTSRLLICLLALALIATGTFAGARSALAASLAANPAPAMLHATGMTERTAVATVKLCKRGAAVALSCGMDQALPVKVAGSDPMPGGGGFERPSQSMTGLSPGCLVGPPRTC